ncbi:trypsin-like serine peptidase [Zobellella aerophila]|uniref:Serine protease n=1 Tax=Zobellella aerophila TaxID=870480 RepID=A0ABP6VQX6_9GAMM
MKTKLHFTLVLTTAILVGCAGYGTTQSGLANKIRVESLKEKSALQDYTDGKYDMAITKWKEIAENLNNEATSQKNSYFTDIRYLDKARILSNIAWSHLTNNNIEIARLYYEDAFNTLYDGEHSHKMILHNSKINEISNMTTMKAISEINMQLASDNISKHISSVAYNYSSQELNDKKFLQPVTPPKFFDDIEDRTSDGIRLNVLPSIPPLLNIGKLDTGGGRCTASLIGYRIALTNSHCVTSGEEKRGKIWILKDFSKMRLNFESVEIPDSVKVVNVIYSQKNKRRGGWLYKDYSQDWAFLVLERHPIKRGHLGITSKISDLKNNKFFLAGYSADQSDGRLLSLHWGCSLLRTHTKNRIYDTNCRSNPGASGSPLLLINGNNKHVYIAGLHAFGKHSTPGTAGGLTTVNFDKEYLELVKKISLPD